MKNDLLFWKERLENEERHYNELVNNGASIAELMDTSANIEGARIKIAEFANVEVMDNELTLKVLHVQTDEELYQLGFRCQGRLVELNGYENVYERLCLWCKDDKYTVVACDFGNGWCSPLATNIPLKELDSNNGDSNSLMDKELTTKVLNVNANEELYQLGFECVAHLRNFRGYESADERLWMWRKDSEHTVVTMDAGDGSCKPVATNIALN